MPIDGKNFTPPATVKPGAKPQRGDAKQLLKPDDAKLAQNQGQQAAQTKDVFQQAQARPELNPVIATRMAGQSAEVANTTLEDLKEKDRKAPTTGKSAPPKPGFNSAITLVESRLLKTLDAARNAGVGFMADLMGKGFKELKTVQLGAKHRQTLQLAETASPQSYRKGLENFFASEVAKKVIAKFEGQEMDEEARLAADIVDKLMGGSAGSMV